MEFNYESYNLAGKICQEVMDEVLLQVKPNKLIYEICMFGDNLMTQKLNELNIKIKGICYPTCVNPEKIVGNYNCSENDKTKLNDNSQVHIELGCHVNGYPVKIGRSIILGENKDSSELENTMNKIYSKIKNYFIEDKTNFKILNKINKICEEDNVSLPYYNNTYEKIPGIFSFQMSKNNLDGKNDDDYDDDEIHNVITMRPIADYDFIPQEFEFLSNEVYCVDILINNKTGKLSESDKITTLYRRNYDTRYNLKLQSSKQCLNYFKSYFVKSINYIKQIQAKFGIKECVNNNLLIPYKIFKVKDGEYFRKQFTVIIKNNNSIIFD